MATRAAAQDPQVEKLRTITNTTQLVRYLHTELDWPVDVDDVDEAFFDWHPDELFLAEEHRVAIGSIKQLRPLTSGQPWGIFFVEFERRRLPIVVLRRVLNSLAIKRRANAKKGGGHQTWHARDLLFVSSFGESGHREIALAHFTDESEHGDLPVLRVLGWDEDDTSLQLAHVSRVLHQRLRWPARTEGAEAQRAWREQWAGAFSLQYRQAINDAKSLALALAQLAKRIRLRANDVLKTESERGHLRKLHQAFKDNLIADLTADGFADMFAQTIAYGLFTAHVSRNSGALVADDVALMVPSTNPFLRDLLQDFLQAAGRARQRNQRVDFDELGINDVVDLLRHAPMHDILRSFNNDRPGEDPVIHFYEDFLKAYDKKMRAKRGVFYTPRPVVQFIVRSVHEILQTEFGIEDGLASTITWGEMRRRKPELVLPAHTAEDSPFVQILDPATGTATFLVETIDLIHRHMLAKWRAQRHDSERIKTDWNAYVRAHLLPRLHGFELMMAPYAIAHMKIGLKLGETGYGFPEDGPRVNIFLTNALEPAHEIQPQLAAMAPMLAHEARAANETKESLAPTIIVGNPPYSLLSGNMSVAHRGLIERFRSVAGARIREKGALQLEKNLNDDYVKFLALGDDYMARGGAGLISFITNHSYLDNPTLRGVRWRFVDRSKKIFLIDLHGNTTKKEKPPAGITDKNVFDIKQGVAIALFVVPRSGSSEVFHIDLWGNRAEKERFLQSCRVDAARWTSLHPVDEQYLFVPQDDRRREEFGRLFPMPIVMAVNGAGYISARDNLVIDFDKDVLRNRIKAFKASTLANKALLEQFAVEEKKGWNVGAAREILKHIDISNQIVPTYYRPFDWRWIFFDSSLVWGRSYPTHKHLSGAHKNIALVATRLTKDQWDVGAVEAVASHKCVSAYDTGNLFPLWLEPIDHEVRRANLSDYFVKALIHSLGLDDTDWQPETANAPLNAEKVFHYLYAVLHSPEYRQRYADFLRIDFPRIPIPGTRALFDALSTLGKQLVQWHLLEHPTALAITATTAPNGLAVPAFFGSDRKLLKVAEKGRELADVKATAAGPTGKVCINATSGFSGVQQAAWQHTIGGYQVLHKWLDDRRKAERSLSDDDIAHWRRIHAALEATQALMGQVDQAIVANGGWPDAFSQDHPPPDPATLAAQPAVKKPRAKRASTGQASLFGDAEEAQPRPKARATPARTRRSAGGATKAGPDDPAAMAALREVLRLASKPLSRADLIRSATGRLGYRRASPRITAALDDAVRRAVRRGIAGREPGGFSLLTRSIGDYEREFLKAQLLACLGREWVPRQEVARRLARWLGFARTGPVIEATAKSLINILLRSGDLQKRRDEVHRA